jgi:prepilin-type N-terminal cleavage/methylation domain-containing protein
MLIFSISRKDNRIKGFGLIELLIVLVILAALLSIASQNFSAYRQNTNLKEAARDISSDMSYWKQRAIAENRRYRIDFRTLTTYTIIQETATNSNIFNDLTTKTIGAGNPNIVLLSAPSFLPGGVTYVTFDPRGTSGNGTIHLKHSVRLSKADIAINMMGRVNVQYPTLIYK